MSEAGSDSEDGRESPIFGFSYDEEGNASSFWAIDPSVAVEAESDAFENGDAAKENAMSPPKSVTFSTASGKPIKISEKALQAAKKKMESDVIENSGTLAEKNSQGLVSSPALVLAGDSTASRKTVGISEKATWGEKMESDTFENNGTSREKTSQEMMTPPVSVRFSTASGKPIPISEKAMLAAKKKMESESFENNGTLVEKKSQELIRSPVLVLVGASTASENTIGISEKATLGEKMEAETFENIDDSPEKTSQELMPPPPPPKFVKFSTASGKAISVSQKAMEEAKKKFDFEDFNDELQEVDSATNIGPVPCTSNVFDFGNQSSLSPEDFNEIDDLTRSLLEDITNDAEWIQEDTLEDFELVKPATEPEKKEEPQIDAQKARTSTKRRILEQYGEPPDLPSLCTPAKRGRLTKKFVPPRPADPK